MKKCFLFLAMLLVHCIPSFAQFDGETIQIDGIYYRYRLGYDKWMVVNPYRDDSFLGYMDGTEATCYTGAITIPDRIKHISYYEDGMDVDKYFSADDDSYREYEYMQGYWEDDIEVSGIAECAFYGSSITSITIPSSVDMIGYGAFCNCFKLKTIDVSSNFCYKDIGDYAYRVDIDNIGLETTEWYKSQPDGLVYLGAVAYRLKTPRKFSSITIKSGTERIGNNCFRRDESEYSYLESVFIPSSVKSIGAAAFLGCWSLKSANIPENVTEIGARAFEGCALAKNSLSLPANLKKLGFSAFRGCGAFYEADVSIPDNIEVFFTSTFADCHLASLEIGRGVRHIEMTNFTKDYFGVYNYYDDFSLSNNSEMYDALMYSLDDNGIDQGAALVRYGLDTSILTVDGNNTVYDSRNGCNAVIETSTNTLIVGCDNTEIPNDVTTIGDCAFKNCNISSINIPSSVVKIGEEAFCGTKLTAVTIPANLESVGAFAYANCPELVSVTLEEGIKSIKDGMFAYCPNLTNITLPASLSSIGMATFYKCDAMGTVVARMEKPASISYDTFNFNADLYVPEGSLEYYQGESYWKTFKTIQEGLRIVMTILGGGHIVSSKEQINYGDEVTLSILPDDGFELESLVVDGIDVTNDVIDDTYTLESVVGNVTVQAMFTATSASITISSLGQTTFCCSDDLDFSEVKGVKAYIASGFFANTGTVLLTRVTDVPAGTGIMVWGDEGTYAVPFGQSSAFYANMLKGSVDPITLEPNDGEMTNYVFTTGASGLCFYKVTKPRPLSAGKAYLQLPTQVVSGSRPLSYVLEDDATAINPIREMKTDCKTDIYDIQGRSVVSPRKGLYIKDGKKVVIK